MKPRNTLKFDLKRSLAYLAAAGLAAALLMATLAGSGARPGMETVERESYRLDGPTSEMSASLSESVRLPSRPSSPCHDAPSTIVKLIASSPGERGCCCVAGGGGMSGTLESFAYGRHLALSGSDSSEPEAYKAPKVCENFLRCCQSAR